MNARRPFQDKPTIRVEGLTLVRGGRRLFAPISFAAGPGEYVELLGANGSGKTSLLRAIAGFLHPRAGSAHIERCEEPSLALHYVGHANGLKGQASVRAHLKYWAGLFGGAPSEDFVVKALNLARVLDAPCRTLSQGQARRLALARLIIAPRPVWLLDEPASALDYQGRAVVGELVEGHRAQGGLVLAAVHEPLGPKPSQTLRLAA
ncbi:MAG: heme ABC exporter ATP-binding protein CcmA [Hyphomonadaceae bacterium]